MSAASARPEAGTHAGWHYRTTTVHEAFDLNTVCRSDGMLFVRDGVGVAARGTLAVLDGENPESLLAAFQPASGSTAPHTPAMGPVLFGLVPFLPQEPARFIVPRFIAAKHADGSATATIIGRSADDVSEDALGKLMREAFDALPPRPSSNSFRVSARTPVSRYLDAVTVARDAVTAGVLRKAVIARDIEVHAEDALDVHAILLRLRASFGSSYRYCVGDVIGASPELLLSVEGRSVRSYPLAGTAPRTGDPATDARLAADLVASTKDQIEHRVVIDMVHDTLLRHCSYLDWEPEPSVVTVANVQHLGTAIEGALAEPVPPVMTLVRELCPTPALGGHPSAEALALISEVEGMSRGWYGGAVGWIDASGNGTFAVTIRCAELSEDRRSARLFAGGGIVADSNPYSELAETQAKFQAMLSAIVRP